jgi:trypsin
MVDSTSTPNATGDGGRNNKKTKKKIVASVTVVALLLLLLLIAGYSRGAANRSKAMFNDEVQQHGTSTTTSLVNRIIGGTKVGNPSNPNVKYPYYMVSVQTSHGHHCGGSLIAQDVVLTAAHCYTPQLTKVVIGRYNITSEEDNNDGEEIMIVGKLRHPDFNNEYMITDNDFMLIFLQRAVAAATTSTTSAANNANNIIIKPIKLNSNTSYPPPNQYATSLGWGDTNIRDNYWNDDDDDDDTTINDYYTRSDVLKTVKLQIVSNIDCENSDNLHVNGRTYNYTNQITDNMICAKGKYRRSGPCYGDSGGPLIFVKSNNNNNNNDDDDGKADVLLVGVVSGAISCATDQFPEIFARVSVAYQWIHCVLCERSEYAIDAGFDCNDDDRRSSSITSTTIIDCPAVTAYPTYSPTYPVSSSSSSISSSIALEDIPATKTTCLTEMECKAKSGGYTRYTSGDYPFYGCFTKGGNLFWGKGGTVEQIMAEDRTFNKATKVFC